MKSLLISKAPGPYKPEREKHRFYGFNPSNTHDKNLLKWTNKYQRLSKEIDARLSSVQTLPAAYDERKKQQLSGFRFFITPSINTERPEGIAFITSIAQSLNSPKNIPASKLVGLKKDYHKLETRLRDSLTIIDGAHLFVLMRIENDYKSAWISKDPKSSQLYQELSQRLGEKTPAEQKTCLETFRDYLNNSDTQAKINFGSLTPEKMLAKINEYIDQLTPTVGLKN
ncbi:hypothetical protein [Legionella yabuuchiae]|uniref:hypothetical protein n=1 Tax=Legionella yabuuchiae TaxID=376727 RepID=UPI0010549D03|nr:hypothetical protein [Legionella yabuuchiae]